jgi:hypothetical protein
MKWNIYNELSNFKINYQENLKNKQDVKAKAKRQEKIENLIKT